MTLFGGPSCLNMMILFCFLWLLFCTNMPYWQTIEKPIIIHFNAANQIINTTVVASSINIGLEHSCLKKNYCFRNEQLGQVLSLPSDRANLIITFGLLGMGFANVFSLLLVFCGTCDCIFILLDGSLWLSFIALSIGFIDVQRVLFFNNWASWGYFMGIIFVFILASDTIDTWNKNRKNRNCKKTQDLTTATV